MCASPLLPWLPELQRGSPVLIRKCVNLSCFFVEVDRLDDLP